MDKEYVWIWRKVKEDDYWTLFELAPVLLTYHCPRRKKKK